METKDENNNNLLEKIDEIEALNYVCHCSTFAELYADMATISIMNQTSFAYRAIYYCIEAAYHADMHGLSQLRENMFELLLFINRERHVFDMAIMTKSQLDYILNTFYNLRMELNSKFYREVEKLMESLKPAEKDSLMEERCLKYLDTEATEFEK